MTNQQQLIPPWSPTHINIKTGGQYQIIGEAIDATNITNPKSTEEGHRLILYVNDTGELFARWDKEFVQKFRPIIHPHFIHGDGLRKFEIKQGTDTVGAEVQEPRPHQDHLRCRQMGVEK